MSNAMLLYAYMGDKELVDKVKTGQKACFEVLIRRHSQSLYRVGRMFGLGHNDVEEILQFTHSVVYQRLRQRKDKVPYRLWALSLMLQNCIERVEAEYDGIQNDYSEPAARPVSDLYATGRSAYGEINQLQKDLELLPFSLRSVFILSEIEGLSLNEVSGLLRVSDIVVKARLGRVKSCINKSINSMYYHTDVYNFNKCCCDSLVDVVMAHIDAGTYHREKALIPKY